MRQSALVGLLTAVVVGCSGLDPEEPWEGDPDGFEPDDIMATAREQRPNAKPVRHTFMSNDIDPDVDWVRVRVTEPDLSTDPEEGTGYDIAPYYQFARLSVAGSPTLEIWKEHGGLYFGPPGSMYFPLLYMQTPGVYFMKFYEASGSGGEYDSCVFLQKQSGGADVAVTSLVVPTSMPTGSNTEVDVEVRVVNQGSSTATDFYVTLHVTNQRYWNGEGELASHYIASIDPLASASPAVVVDFTFTGVDFSGQLTGPVYVVARADISDSDVSNNFCVASTLHAVDTDDDWDTEDADDDDTTDTTRLSAVPGTPEAHTFFPAGDVDVVPLTIASGQEGWYEIWTSNIRGGANTRIDLLADDKSLLKTACGNGLESGSTYVKWYLGSATTYFIWIEEAAGVAGAYDLNVRKSTLVTGPDTLEFDDDLDNKDDIRPWHAIPVPEDFGLAYETTVTRNFHCAGDVDWLVYAVPRKYDMKQHSITSAISGSAVPQYTLFKSDGFQIDVDDDATEMFGAAVDRTLAAGLYYIKIVDSAGTETGDYQVLASVTEP